jgi:Domain of unknown function (DUF4262)
MLDRRHWRCRSAIPVLVGLFANYGHPEVIIFDRRPDIAGAIINMVRDRAAAGHRFADGDIDGDC